MLFLITPHGVHWIDIPRAILQAPELEGADLGVLDWKPTEEPHDYPTLVSLALRHGRPCSTGIVLDVRVVLDVERPDKLRASHRAVVEAQANLPKANEELMEAVMPGWIESGRQLDREVAQSVEKSITVASDKARQLLGAEVNPALVDHWERIGGVPTD